MGLWKAVNPVLIDINSWKKEKRKNFKIFEKESICLRGIKSLTRESNERDDRKNNKRFSILESLVFLNKKSRH